MNGHTVAGLIDPTLSSSSAGHSLMMGPADFCKRCGMVGSDVKILDCGCSFHARCTPVGGGSNEGTPCPACHRPSRTLHLVPMDFLEIDQAKAAAANMAPSNKRGRKRKNATLARLNPTSSSSLEDGGDSSELRTGRWTQEETDYCDILQLKFETGELPLSDGMKLNDFLSGMLKSKQSRLTKKMKNARLSAKTYSRQSGYIMDPLEARRFSELETSFYESIQCDLERAEIKFHMQKEWREMFSSYCVALGKKLDAGQWLNSVEEMDRRSSAAKDAARMARRKVMMGYALNQDAANPEQGVFIAETSPGEPSNERLMQDGTASSAFAAASMEKKPRTGSGQSRRTIRDYSSPFVGKVIQFIERHGIPFEHIDAWVPSIVSNSPDGGEEMQMQPDQKCRLCFAGCATTETQVPANGSRPIPMDSQDQFDLLSFGDYSQKFSFDVGCGLPGRVYSSGVCSWEQGVENAPSRQFERCGGATQWGIKTVLGVPIPSPNVGRVVVLFYSRFDRARDPDLVRKITDELTKLMPTPKWKLVVDIGAAPPKPMPGKPLDPRVSEVLNLITDNIPSSKNSPFAPYLPGFTSLRLLLMQQVKTAEDENIVSTLLESYSAYQKMGRQDSEVAWMIARDYMLLSQSSDQRTRKRDSSGQTNQAHGRLVSSMGASVQQPVANLGIPGAATHNMFGAAQPSSDSQSNGVMQLAALLQQQAYSPALTPIVPMAQGDDGQAGAALGGLLPLGAGISAFSSPQNHGNPPGGSGN